MKNYTIARPIPPTLCDAVDVTRELAAKLASLLSGVSNRQIFSDRI